MAALDLQPEPEILDLGPSGRRRRWGPRAVLLAVLVLVLGTGGLFAVRLWPEPPRDLTLADLQGAYAGMVRSDGVNEAYTIDPRTFSSRTTVPVRPASCQPLVAETMGNRLPTGARDGVSTYWLGNRTATVSLFTLRFDDAVAARRLYDTITDALTACLASGGVVGVGTERGRLSRAEDGDDVGDRLGYVFARSGGGLYAFHVLRFANTLSWQFRYDPSARHYDPLPAVQLMAGLASQLHDVQDAGG